MAICIYHSRDLDGWMSGAIVKLKYPSIELIGWDYGQPIPDLSKENQIILVDISFPKDIMKDLWAKNGLNFVWCDHHISAIKEMDEALGDYTISYPIQGLRDAKFAACELTWQYFFTGEPMPELVRLLGRYDCFGHKGTDEEQKVLEVQYGARAIISNPDEAYKELVDNIHCDNTELQIWSIGRGIYKYLCSEAKHSYKTIFPVELDGYKFACINQNRFNPVNFGINYHDDGYDGFACFWYANGKYNYSLYNDNGHVDCSEIAKKRGGGGHKGASGFISNEIIL